MAPLTPRVPTQVIAQSLNPPLACTGTFITHALPYTTSVHQEPVQLFESNGAGVAIGDLNGDGGLDLVFANLAGPNTILWNQGQLTFRPQALDDTNARAVNLVDVDGDTQLDIVFTHRTAGLSYWRNEGTTGEPHFTRHSLAGVLYPAYAMAWGDLNGDQVLDLVTGSYDAELDKELGNHFLFNREGGVYVYQQVDGHFQAVRLATSAQALALLLVDLNEDTRLDLIVGNDFDLPDAAWLREGGGWRAVAPFTTTPHSTMSYDHGDIDNDGQAEIVAVDMKPYAIDVQTLAAWLPVMTTMPEPHHPTDPQRMTNVLQVPNGRGQFVNRATERGLDATGWSWSAKFGDLDNDGFLDFYAVNGMIAHELFGHLPADELVEQNQARRNLGDGTFAPWPQWQLGTTASGRGMSMADLDQDGDLDIVVNNLRTPAQLFENQQCGGGSLLVELAWPDSGNSQALGAQLVLQSSTGRYLRDVRAGSGYLSGDPPRVHFGFPATSQLQALVIRWPDGKRSQIEPVAAHQLLKITRRDCATCENQ